MSTLKINTDGTLAFVYNDKLRALLDEGDATIQRASHVEPTVEGKWTADLTPVSGPVLGPFTTRGEALKKEVDWLELNYISS